MTTDRSPVIRAEGLSKRFGNISAVDHVSFTVGRHEVLGILGTNDSGKTTLLRLIATYLAPDAGTASVESHDVLDDPMAVRSVIGYLPESAPLYPDMEAQDHLQFIAALRGLNRAARRDGIERAVELCGLEDVLTSRPAGLSPGFRRRLALACVVLHDPDVLVLDEPTGGLGPNEVVELREIVGALARDRTVVLASHVLPEVRSVSTKVLVMDHGRSLGEAAPDELGERPLGAGVAVSILAPGAELGKALRSLPSVEVVEELGPDEDGYERFALSGGPERELADDLFELVRDGGWRLRELSPSGVSLEDVFLQLAPGRKSPAAKEGDR